MQTLPDIAQRYDLFVAPGLRGIDSVSIDAVRWAYIDPNDKARLQMHAHTYGRVHD